MWINEHAPLFESMLVGLQMLWLLSVLNDFGQNNIRYTTMLSDGDSKSSDVIVDSKL